MNYLAVFLALASAVSASNVVDLTSDNFDNVCCGLFGEQTIGPDFF